MFQKRFQESPAHAGPDTAKGIKETGPHNRRRATSRLNGFRHKYKADLETTCVLPNRRAGICIPEPDCLTNGVCAFIMNFTTGT